MTNKRYVSINHFFTNKGYQPSSSIMLLRVSDPYSFFTDPDPVDPEGGQYGSGSNPDPGL